MMGLAACLFMKRARDSPRSKALTGFRRQLVLDASGRSYTRSGRRCRDHPSLGDDPGDDPALLQDLQGGGLSVVPYLLWVSFASGSEHIPVRSQPVTRQPPRPGSRTRFSRPNPESAVRPPSSPAGGMLRRRRGREKLWHWPHASPLSRTCLSWSSTKGLADFGPWHCVQLNPARVAYPSCPGKSMRTGVPPAREEWQAPQPRALPAGSTPWLIVW